MVEYTYLVSSVITFTIDCMLRRHICDKDVIRGVIAFLWKT